MHPSFAAAALALVILFVTVGTILQVDPPSEPRIGVSAAPPPSAGWDETLRRLVQRTERGLERMAGLPRRP